jgi:hypothetical protein
MLQIILSTLEKTKSREERLMNKGMVLVVDPNQTWRREVADYLSLRGLGVASTGQLSAAAAIIGRTTVPLVVICEATLTEEGDGYQWARDRQAEGVPVMIHSHRRLGDELPFQSKHLWEGLEGDTEPNQWREFLVRWIRRMLGEEEGIR